MWFCTSGSLEGRFLSHSETRVDPKTGLILSTGVSGSGEPSCNKDTELVVMTSLSRILLPSSLGGFDKRNLHFTSLSTGGAVRARFRKIFS